MDVGALAVAVEDHDELGGAVERLDRVRRHGRELGGLPGLDRDPPVGEVQPDATVEDVEPLAARAVASSV